MLFDLLCLGQAQLLPNKSGLDQKAVESSVPIPAVVTRSALKSKERKNITADLKKMVRIISYSLSLSFQRVGDDRYYLC